jgi:phosphotransferase family enzyme
VTRSGDEITDREFLLAAARLAGLDSTGASIIRDGSNVIFRLPNNVVARIGQPGTSDTAIREVQVSRWIAKCGLPVVEALTGVPQDIIVNDHPITWWAELPEHRAATPAELAAVLRAFHSLPEPENVDLPRYDPFAGLDELTSASVMTDDERTWLSGRLDQLRGEYRDVKFRGVIHGDAWQANVAVTKSGRAILLDLEKVSRGRRDWDLIHIAVDYTDFGRLSNSDYRSFVESYGDYDVTLVDDYRILADIQELRWLGFALKKAMTSSGAAHEARHRFACLRGQLPRPWSWRAL